LDWEKVKIQSELLAIQVQQLRIYNKDIEEAKLRKQQKQTKAKKVFDSSKQLRKTEIIAKDTVLWYNTKLELDRSTINKLVYK
jgi:hypothetical protein